MPPQITCASAICTSCQNGETWKSHFSLNWIVLHTQCTCALSSWKKNLSSVMCLIASNICWDSKIPLILSIDFYFRLDEEQLSPFAQGLTPWQTWLTQSMWVTDSSMLCSLPRSCLVHPVDRFDSEGWFSSDQMLLLTVFSVFLVKKHTAFKWKDAISGFPVSPGNAQALVKWCGKIKYILIAYFLGNICAKNCRNRTVYVKIMGSCKGETFFETLCS